MKRLKRNLKKIIGIFNLLTFKISKAPILKKANLVFYFPYYHLGGAEQVHLDIVKAVQHKKCVVIITHASATPYFLPALKEVATVIELNSIINKKSKTVTRLLLKSIAYYINSSKTVHKVLGCNSVYFYESLPYIKKEKLDLIHAVAPDDWTRAMLANAAPHLHKRIAINKNGVTDLNTIYKNYHIPLEKQPHVAVISNGIAFPQNDMQVTKAVDCLNIGFVGRWSQEKRPELYLEIASSFKGDKKLQWSMAGSGLKHRNELITTAGVINLEQINDKHILAALYKKLHFILITSTYEGFPMVLMEAMAHGVIPVCTNVGGISEHITHGINGFLVDVNNKSDKELVAQFAALIELFKSDAVDLNKIGLACSAYAKAYFSIEKFNQAYNKLLTYP